jgi:hypothetical protein
MIKKEISSMFFVEPPHTLGSPLYGAGQPHGVDGMKEVVESEIETRSNLIIEGGKMTAGGILSVRERRNEKPPAGGRSMSRIRRSIGPP